MNLGEKLNSIRATIDTDVSGCDIDTVQEFGKKLSSLMGLSAECKAEATKRYDEALLRALDSIKDSPPSVMLKKAQAMCADEHAKLEYADRLNAAITHQLDFVRTLISAWKVEMENSVKM